LAYESYDGCSVEPSQVSVAYWKDGKGRNARPISVDGFRLKAHMLRRVGAEVLLFGGVTREFDNATMPKAPEPDSTMYSRANAMRSDEQHAAVVIRLNSSLGVANTDMVLTGVDNFAEDADVLGSTLFVVGSNMDRQFAFRLPLSQ
jgi:hypothetical protein